jgi:hypothetical protein
MSCSVRPKELMWRIVTSAAVISLLAYLVVAACRLAYPYELEWMEGGSVDHVARVLAGAPLYVSPSVAFVPYIYPPLYYYLAALVAKATGCGFLPLRLVSLAASLGVLTLIHALVARESGRRGMGLLAAGLFAATFAASGGWFDLARVDSLFLFLTLGAAWLCRGAPSRARSLGAGVCLALACLTKQTALVIAAPLLLHAAVTRGRRALDLIVPAVALTLGGAVLLDRAHHGWFAYYLLRIPAGHRLLWPELALFWTRDLLPSCGVVLLLALPLLRADLDRARGEGRGFYVALTAGMVTAAWLARLHDGGWLNVLMPAHAALMITGALGADHLLRRRCEWRLRPSLASLVPLVCLIQFGALLYNPRRFVPGAADRDAGDRLVREIAALPGPVYVPQHGWLATLAGKPPHAQGQAVLDILRSGDHVAADGLRRALADSFATHRFAGVVLDDTPALAPEGTDPDWMEKQLAGFYAPTGRLVYAGGEFTPLVGMQTRPATIWTPLAAAAMVAPTSAPGDGPSVDKRLLVGPAELDLLHEAIVRLEGGQRVQLAIRQAHEG